MTSRFNREQQEEKMHAKQILALDLGSNTGWALRGKDHQIYSGTQAFKPDRFSGGGMVMLKFRNWLENLHQTSGGIDLIVFEEVRRHVGTTAAHVYGGFLGQMSAWGEENEIPYQGVPVGTIKKHITGKGNASKDEVVQAVIKLHHNPKDDNEADALALIQYAIDMKIGG